MKLDQDRRATLALFGAMLAIAGMGLGVLAAMGFGTPLERLGPDEVRCMVACGLAAVVGLFCLYRASG